MSVLKNFPKMTIIMRGSPYDQVRCVAEAMKKAGTCSVEISMTSSDALDIIKKLSEEFAGDLLVGAGTVRNMADAVAAVRAKAKFLLSPVIMEREMIEYAHENNVLAIPGAFSPSEIYQMYLSGADIVKVFPVSTLELGYGKAVKAPLGNIPLMGVGGVGLSNAAALLKSGIDYLGIGGKMFEKEDIVAGNVANLARSIEKYKQAIGVI
ncbi:bifunctional 4-hydroxy-2-oxoglutarate aldolase/2-dehydro-3-deoxy-phosphogluconate aldolase [Caproiciproducens sp. CPB-2]|uniref:bifunctional 4-hydroxy-2-oxoglutarate aldolase/2-dehydro-3-deoxy-phosphogluconate aldolase n=1 Tax=Caproiciproducens sp. CPB-2 TaxID=3030017 RepID=UPI0023DB9C52|nr:bifunctional 4-hydroxy-2-oxoglutarate aldolase/2-dehydro-3-deoxy-phosphogluconate aldolase [Caproiciproducens sp. CPB-2]MDF1495334.1 bifunctional 4-hydroxy-2-oxoglutarate aldolase/2-dehydro-3-deoxy-phosphogluconate aldolase [Caproiciproducens sp. CPB-2]